MNILSIFSKNNERTAQGVTYDNFTSLATRANDNMRSGGSIGDRTIRLTRDGKGIATTTFSGSSGARVDQIKNARKMFLDAVEQKFGLAAREKAVEIMSRDGEPLPLTSRLIKAVDESVNPYAYNEKAVRFVASQRAVFDRAIEDAVVSIANMHPNAQFNVDPVDIEKKVIELVTEKEFPMTAQGLASAVAQVVAASSVVREPDADDGEVRQMAQSAKSGVEKSVEKAPIPKIRNQAEFEAFFSSLSVSSQYGTVKADEKTDDADGEERQTFVFKGIVFRSDARGPDDPTMADGFTSRNDLSDPKNRTEAMGLGVSDGGGKAYAFGATGRSGVSCAKSAEGAVGYLNPGTTFYVIDTTKLPKGEKAWDMENNIYQNGYKQRKDPTEDETKGEVNVSYIPRNAIIGWVKVSDMYLGTQDSNNSNLETLQGRITWDKKYSITFNTDYEP